jgi:hypothetical protein
MHSKIYSQAHSHLQEKNQMIQEAHIMQLIPSEYDDLIMRYLSSDSDISEIEQNIFSNEIWPIIENNWGNCSVCGAHDYLNDVWEDENGVDVSLCEHCLGKCSHK